MAKDLKTVQTTNDYKIKSKASNETMVTQASDLAGELNGYYLLLDNVSVDSIDVLSGAAVFIEMSKGISLTLTGTGDLIGDGTSKPLGQLSISGGSVFLTGAGATLFNTNGFIVTCPDVSFLAFAAGIDAGQCINTTLSIDFKRAILSELATGLFVDGLGFSLDIDKALFSSSTLTGPAFSIGSNVPLVEESGLRVALPAGTSIFKIDNSFVGSAKISNVTNITGTAINMFDPTGLDQESKYVNVTNSDPFAPSHNIISVIVTDNTTATVISTIDTWTDLNLNAMAVAGSNIELWTITNTTTGECRYDGLPPLSGINDTTISAVSSGGSQKFKFRYVVNGSPISDGVEIPMELSSETKNLTLRAPLGVVTNDLVRIQVKNVDGTSNVVIEDLSEGGR